VFLNAMAARDAKVFESTVATSFASFVYGRTYDKTWVIGRFTAASDGPRATRTCERVQTRIGPSAAVYTAECTDKFPAYADMPAYEAAGLFSVVLATEGTAWKVAYTSYQTAGLETERGMWNDTFQRNGGFRKEPNQHLLDSVKGRKPGKALDIAMGQGRNVLGLAALGWKTTGVDISDAGIKLAKDAAAKRKLTFEGVVEDVEKYDLGTAKWDLVTLIYAGTDPTLIERIKKSLKKGGLFVVEFFHKDATSGVGIGGFATGELAAQFAGWTIIKDEVVDDIADWGLRKTKVVRFAAQKN
jgi:SAM-dependent methyltransferase